jgi:hypothetical protein
MQDPKAFYLARIGELTLAGATLKKKGERFGWLRLFVVVLAGVTFYFAFSFTLHLLWLTLAFTILFLRLVQLHLKNNGEIETLTTIAHLCSDEIRLMQGDHSVFDPGPSDEYKKHIYANDLDIFGTTSLFKSVNRTVTFGGRRMLIDSLLEPLMDPAGIVRRQVAVSDLAIRVEWRQRFFAIGARSGETTVDSANLSQWIRHPWFFEGRKRWLWIASVASALSFGAIAWMIVEGRFLFGVFAAVIIVNTAVFQLLGKEVRHYFNGFGSRTSLFRKFSEMFQMVANEELASDLGRELRRGALEASSAFLKLSRLHNLAEQRANGLVSMVMNGLFMFDIWTIYRIEKWRRIHHADALPWIETLNHIDMLASCANFRFNHPSFTEATIIIASPSISAQGMGHPLIPVDTAVVNDYEVGSGSRAHVITGSNMAGKSTFIRAVGLNVVLALNGLPVFARTFSCSVMEIASCIRITDSLEDHVSYFRAELDRLVTITEMLRTGKPYLVLLDEILRGTNSDDKRQGTVSFYKRLAGFNCICLLATHDLTIGELSKDDPQRFANFCFESSLEGNELRFDYVLKPGVSRSANASFLMRKLDLID